MSQSNQSINPYRDRLRIAVSDALVLRPGGNMNSGLGGHTLDIVDPRDRLFSELQKLAPSQADYSQRQKDKEVVD